MVTGLAAIPFGLEKSGWITPYQAKIIIIVGAVALVCGILLWVFSFRIKRAENIRLVKNLPSLLTAIDARRGEVIQSELDKRIGKGNTQFVFSMLKDTWLILVGDEMPELPERKGDEDFAEIVGIILSLARNTKKGIKKMQKSIAKLGDKEAGLLIARKANEHLGIDDKLARHDRRNKKLIKKLKLARENLPSDAAVEATKAIDNYLDFSRAYRALDIVIITLTHMINKIDLLKDIPVITQIVDKFQRYREQYSEEMNINLAKVNEALKQL